MHQFLHLRSMACFAFLAFFCSTAAAEDQSIAARPLIVCFGDSITQHGYPQELQKLLHVRVINAGVGGNTSGQGVARLEDDVLSHGPNLVVFFFGTNDSRRDAPHKQLTPEQYRTNLVTIVDRCRQSGAKVIIGVSPPIVASAYFQRHPETNYAAVGGFTAYVEKFRDAARSVGKEKNIPVVDLGELLKKYPDWVSEDGVHPTPKGNKILAQLIAEKVRQVLNLPDAK